MTLPATDNFNRADGSLGSNWTQATGTNSPRVRSNGVDNYDGAADDLAYWNADTFNNDQYSQLVYKSGNSVWLGPAVRVTSGNGYGLEAASGNTRYLGKLVGNVYTELANNLATFTANDVYRMEVSGTSLVVKVNGSNIFSVTDASLASGRAGLAGYGSSSGTTAWDDWEGGNLGATAVSDVPMRRMRSFSGLIVR